MKIDHKFTYPEFNYEATPNVIPAIKVSYFVKKLDSISYEDFFRHWQTVHADLVVATKVFKNHILRYSQHHQTPELKQSALNLTGRAGGNVLDYDGCAELWVRTWDDWVKFSASEEFATAMKEDCDRFMQTPLICMVGYENLMVGDASRSVGGRDGLCLAKL